MGIKQSATSFYFGETITNRLVNYKSKKIDFTFNPEDIPLVAQDNGLSTSVAGSFPPNAFGLYDMHGNIYEWCADPVNTYGDGCFEGAPQDGSVWVEENSNFSEHMIRGGSWFSDKDECTSNSRQYYPFEEYPERDLSALREKEQLAIIVGFRIMCLAPRFSEILSIVDK